MADPTLSDSSDHHPKYQGNTADTIDIFRWPYYLIIMFWKFINLF